jgi:cobalt-zinc-cadmium resistance protein CzcA
MSIEHAALRFAIQRRWLVVVATAAMAGLGLFNFGRLPIDAVPDITNVQVQINTAVEGLSPIDVEQRVTLPIETAMAGLPGLEGTRSLSRYGLSQVTAVFRDGTDLYFARQLVNERLQEARGNLPRDLADPVMGPIATGLGEIFMWTIEARPGARKPDGAPYTTMDLREIQDWVVKPQLRTVLGVTEINTIGGYEKQIHVTPDPIRLIAYGLTFHDVLLALHENNGYAGGGYIAHKGEQYLVSYQRAPRNLGRDRPGGGGDAQPRADPGARRRGRRPGESAAQRCRDRERRGSRARHRVHADRREQPDGVEARRRAVARGEPQPAGGRDRQAGL